MQERAVLTSEVVQVLMTGWKVPDWEPHHGEGSELWKHLNGVMLGINEPDKMICTVYLDGARKDAWEHKARTRRSMPQSHTERLLALTKPQRQAKPSQPRRGRPAASKGVQVVNVLDGMAPALKELALKAAGGDARRIKIISPGRVEIVDKAS
jgi:hypothetical protein